METVSNVKDNVKQYRNEIPNDGISGTKNADIKIDTGNTKEMCSLVNDKESNDVSSNFKFQTHILRSSDSDSDSHDHSEANDDGNGEDEDSDSSGIESDHSRNKTDGSETLDSKQHNSSRRKKHKRNKDKGKRNIDSRNERTKGKKHHRNKTKLKRRKSSSCSSSDSDSNSDSDNTDDCGVTGGTDRKMNLKAKGLSEVDKPPKENKEPTCEHSSSNKKHFPGSECNGLNHKDIGNPKCEQKGSINQKPFTESGGNGLRLDNNTCSCSSKTNETGPNENGATPVHECTVPCYYKVLQLDRQESTTESESEDEDGDPIVNPDNKAYPPHDTDVQGDGTAVDGVDVSHDRDSDCDISLIKSKTSQLHICRDRTFCKVESRTSKVKDKKVTRHYVMKEDECTDIIGETGLRPLDELLEVNKKKLKNKKQKDVKGIFENIRAKKGTKKVTVNLRIRRWVASGRPMHERTWIKVKTILINLVLEQTHEQNPCRWIIPRKLTELRRRPVINKLGNEDRQLRVVDRSLTQEKTSKLKKGNIEDVKVSNKTKVCRYREDRVYISGVAFVTNEVGLCVISHDNPCWLYEQSFSGFNTVPKPVFSSYIFCLRIFIRDTNGMRFITSNIDQSSDEVTFVSGTNDLSKIEDNIDERCFIRFRRPDGRELYVSLIYRDRFIAHNRDTNRLYMKRVPRSVQTAYVRGIRTKKFPKEYYEAEGVLDDCSFYRYSDKFMGKLGRLFKQHLCGLNHHD